MVIVPPRTAVIRQELIDGIKGLFGKALKKVDTLSGAWTEETVKTVVATAPAVYVAWIGGRRDVKRNIVIGTWALFSTASALSGQRRNEASSDDINDMLIAWLDDRQLAAASGAAVFTQIANLYTASGARSGTVVCGIYFEIPQQMPETIDDSNVGKFETYFHQWAVADGAPVQESLNTGLYSKHE